MSADNWTPAPQFSTLQRGARLPEDLLSEVVRCTKNGAVLFAIGAVEDPVVAYYRREDKHYEETELKGVWEVVSLLGNVTRKEGQPFLHAHATLSGAGGHTRGGHLVRATVAVTLEIALWHSAIPDRSFDADIGLFLVPPQPLLEQ
ncbi:MAG: hypothetical protein KatS3mg100_579 [Candidatus Parcubacteria bacterium]|nr:MAG: hypothetical protein KatS3mg100_579 [Candidatus Parcubacteria bacterium]